MISSIGSSTDYLSSWTSQVSSASQSEKNVFQLADSNSDNSIDGDELESLVSSISQATGEELDTASVLENYDSDGDESLNSDELLSMISDSGYMPPPPSGGPPPPPPSDVSSTDESDDSTTSTDSTSESSDLTASILQGMQQDDPFSIADEDEDGMLNSSELDSLLEGVNDATGLSLNSEDAINGYDSDGDGSLSSDELSSYLSDNNALPSGPTEGEMPPPPPQDDGEMSSIMGMAMSAYAQNSGVE